MTANSQKNILLDWDGTLASEMWRLLPGAKDALIALKDLGHPIVLYSHNKSAPLYATYANVHQYFDAEAVGCYDNTKQWNWEHVTALWPRVPHKNFILFDDVKSIVDAHRTRGGTAIKINPCTGLSVQDLVRANLYEWHEVFGYGLY